MFSIGIKPKLKLFIEGELVLKIKKLWDYQLLSD